ncbi:MAG: winged helix-turn-helix transcriptional regulator [Actinomycetota bacterium]
MTSRDQYCPIYRSLDLFGDRWGLLIVREILRGVTHFNELERSLPGISRSTLAQRLRHLEKEGIVLRGVLPEQRGTEYELSPAGLDLVAVLEAVNNWGVRWLIPQTRPSEMDPDGLMQWIGRHVILGTLPARRVVVRFELRGRNKRRFWLVLRAGEASLCPDHPGFPEDVFITAKTADVYQLFVGRLSFQDALRQGSISAEGAPALIRALPRWFRLRSSGPTIPHPS